MFVSQIFFNFPGYLSGKADNGSRGLALAMVLICLVVVSGRLFAAGGGVHSGRVVDWIELINHTSVVGPPEGIQVTRRVEQIYRNNPQHAAQELFSLLLELELDVLSLEPREFIVQAVKDAIVLRPSSPNKRGQVELGGVIYFHPELEEPLTIELRLPQQLIETEVHYWILFHEVFHFIQYELIVRNECPGQRAECLSDVRLQLEEHAEMRYLIERGAMAAEWKMLSLIPPERKQKIIALVESVSGLRYRDREFFAEVFSRDFFSAQEYVRFQHSLGRHAKKSIR